MSIRNESKSRQGISPFYVVAGVAVVSLAVMAFLILTNA